VGLREWLTQSGRSAVLRGASTALVATAPTVPDYQDALTGGGALFVKQLLNVRYPAPTDVTVSLGVTLGTGGVRDAFFSRLPAIPPTVGAATSPGYTDAMGAFIVQWGVGAYLYQAIADLGAGVLSLPSVDSVTVSFVTRLTAPVLATLLPSTQVMCGVLPGLSPGAHAVCSRVPVLIGPAATTTSAFRQGFARDWRVSFSPVGPPPIVIAGGPVAVRLTDDLTAVQSSELVIFAAAGLGLEPRDQVWQPTASGISLYSILNAGAVALNVKISERIAVG